MNKYTRHILKRVRTIIYGGVLLSSFLSLLGCQSLKRTLPDHTRDYKVQAVEVARIKFPPDIAPIAMDDYYPIPAHIKPDLRNSDVSLTPPLNTRVIARHYYRHGSY